MKVEVQCIVCKAKKKVGPQRDQPLCDRCFVPMIITGARAR